MTAKPPEVRNSTESTTNPSAAELERAIKTEMVEAFNQMQRYRRDDLNKALYNNYHDRYVRLATQLRDHMMAHGEQEANLAVRLTGHIKGTARLIDDGVKEPPGLDYVKAAQEVGF